MRYNKGNVGENYFNIQNQRNKDFLSKGYSDNKLYYIDFNDTKLDCFKPKIDPNFTPNFDCVLENLPGLSAAQLKERSIGEDFQNRQYVFDNDEYHFIFTMNPDNPSALKNIQILRKDSQPSTNNRQFANLVDNTKKNIISRPSSVAFTGGGEKQMSPLDIELELKRTKTFHPTFTLIPGVFNQKFFKILKQFIEDFKNTIIATKSKQNKRISGNKITFNSVKKSVLPCNLVSRIFNYVSYLFSNFRNIEVLITK